MTHPVRTQARAIIVRNGKLALVESRVQGQTFWVLPGGGQDAGEDLVATLRRECREELAVDVTVGALRIVREYVPDRFPALKPIIPTQCIDFVFDCVLPTEQDIRLGPALEEESVGVAWWPLADLSGIPLYPRALTPYFVRYDPCATDITYLGNVR